PAYKEAARKRRYGNPRRNSSTNTRTHFSRGVSSISRTTGSRSGPNWIFAGGGSPPNAARPNSAGPSTRHTDAVPAAVCRNRLRVVLIGRSLPMGLVFARRKARRAPILEWRLRAVVLGE